MMQSVLFFGKSAPANIFGKGFLLLCRRKPVFCLDLVGKAERFYVGLVLAFFSAWEVQALTNNEVAAAGLLRGFLLPVSLFQLCGVQV